MLPFKRTKYGKCQKMISQNDVLLKGKNISFKLNIFLRYDRKRTRERKMNVFLSDSMPTILKWK